MNKQKKIISEAEALSRLMKLCSKSEKSVFEIKQKLKQWGLDSKIDLIITKLKSEKFIDDLRFAKAFSNDKFLFNKWGKIKIKYLLNRHQISGNIIDEALSQINEEDYSKMVEEEMTKKNQSLKISNLFKRKARLYSFGSQRGYESDLINRFLNKERL